MQHEITLEEAKKLVSESQGCSSTQTGVEIIFRYSDGSLLVKYNDNFKAGDRLMSNRRLCFVKADGRIKWDMIAE